MSFIVKRTGEIPQPTTTTILPQSFILNIGGGSTPSGGFSALYRSINSGGSWTLVKTGVNPEFFITSMDFIDKNIGLAGGFGGTLFRTTNAGATWTRIGSATSPIHPDADNTFHVINGVKNTETFYLGNSPNAAAGGNIYRSTNRGLTFTKVGSTFDSLIRGIHTFNASTLIVVCDDAYGSGDRLFKSTDSGNTFTGKISSSVSNNDFRDVDFNANRGFAIGNNGAFWESSDSGDTWIDRTGDLPINFGTSINGNIIKFISLNTVYIIGQYVGGIGVLKSTNRGTTWIDISSSARFAQVGNGLVRSSDWFDENNGWILLSDGEILKTINGGTSWTSSSIIDSSSESENPTTFNSSVNIINVTPNIILPPTTTTSTTSPPTTSA